MWKNILKNTFAKKGRLPTFCSPQRWQASSFLCIFDTNYCSFRTEGTFASFWLNFNPKLANASPGQNVGKRNYPPQIWRLRRPRFFLKSLVLQHFRKQCFLIPWVYSISQNSVTNTIGFSNVVPKCQHSNIVATVWFWKTLKNNCF